MFKCLCLIKMVNGYDFSQNISCDHLLFDLLWPTERVQSEEIIALSEINFDDIFLEMIFKVSN